MARKRLASVQESSPVPDALPSAKQVLESGHPFVPFPTFSILDWHKSVEGEASFPPPPFAKWLSEKLQEGRPVMLRDFDKLDEWDPQVFNLERLIELSTSKQIQIRSCENGRGQNCTLRSYVDAMKSASGGLPNLYARDLPCPQTWMEQSNRVVPAELQWGGPMDLFQWLPQYARSEVMMAYVGSKGSHSGFHRCFGSTVALNLLVEAQENVVCFGTDHDSQSKYDAFMDSRGASSHADWRIIAPNELQNADFPIYVQEQRIGDLVIFPPATAHQVWNVGRISAKLVWNILHPLSVEVGIDYVQPSYNRICHPDVARTNLSLACAVLSLTSRDSLRTLPPELPLLTKLFRRLVNDESINEPPATAVKLICLPYASVAECNFCGTAIWNRHVQCSKCKDFDVCLTCFATGRSCEHISSYIWAEIVPVETLELALSRAKEALGPEAIDATPEAADKEVSLATCVNRQLTLRSNGRSRLCHLCRTEHPEWKGRFCETCSTFFCFRGLYRHFELMPMKVSKHASPWTCPKCKEICNCRCCHFQNAHVARPKPPKKQRVASVDPRGKTLGFMDNVFDKKRQSEHLGVLANGNKRASSTLILPSAEKKGQKRSLSAAKEGPDQDSRDSGAHLRPLEPQISAYGPLRMPLSNMKASHFRDFKIEKSTPSTDIIDEPQYLGSHYTPSVTATATPTLHRTPTYSSSYAESNDSSSMQPRSTMMPPDFSKAESTGPGSGLTVPQLEEQIHQLRSYADQLLELSLHESHETLMQRLANLEHQLKVKKVEKSNELIGKLSSDFPALAEVTKKEMEKLGYLK